MGTVVTIHVADDFSPTPGGRWAVDGPYSGQEFRTRFLEEHFRDPQSDYPVHIILDGVEGYSNSFLEEAFGGLARIFGAERVLDRPQFVSGDDPLLVEEIQCLCFPSTRQ